MNLADLTDQQLRDYLAEIDATIHSARGNGYSDSIEAEIDRRWPRLEILRNWVHISSERDQEAHFRQHPDARNDVMQWLDAPASELTTSLEAAHKAVRWHLLYQDDTLLRERTGWTQDQCAEHCGITPSTWRSYAARYPEPLAPLGHDFQTGAVLWDTDLIRMWQTLRPGQGARTELETSR